MKISGSIFVAMAAAVILLAACQSRQNTKTADLAPNAHQVTAEEVIQTSMYTYVRVSSDGRDYWVAINKADIKEGETYYWSIGAEMNNFTSKELKRTFPSIFFIQDFTDQPITPHRVSPTTMPAQTVQPQQEFKALEVPRASGGVTIAELFSGRDKFAGKKVRISGQVVKFSPEIMNRNWVHLQDGSRDGDNYDLTITTQATVRVGEIVTFEGTVAVKKDFGAGYFYEVIIEEANLVK